MRVFLQIFSSFLFTILNLLVFSACQSELVNSEVYNTIIQLPSSEREFQRVVIDCSNPDDYSHFVSGWYLPSPGKIPNTRFLWSKNQTSVVKFNWEKPQDLELLISCRPFVYEGSPPVKIKLEMNDIFIGRITLSKDWQVYRLEIPEKAIVDGQNKLVLYQPRLFNPSQIWENSIENRDLGSTYSYFVLRPIRRPLNPDFYTLSEILGAKNFHYKGLPRNVLSDFTPSRFSFPIKLPSSPILSFGSGMLPDQLDAHGSSVNFKVIIRTESESKVLFKTTENPPKRVLEQGWSEHKRDLSKFRYQDVFIDFITSYPENDNRPKTNIGSWLDPIVLNRHVPINFVFLIGSDPNWPPTSSQPGSFLEQLDLCSYDINGFDGVPKEKLQFSESAQEVNLPFPIHFIEFLQSEGWQIGYFYTGRNQLIIEDSIGTKFDAVVGRNECSEAQSQEILNQALDWMRRIEGENFCIILDLQNSDSDLMLNNRLYNEYLSTIINLRFPLDSLIFAFNSSNKNRPWLHTPGKKTVGLDAEKTLNWETFKTMVWDLMALEEYPPK